MNRGAHPLYLAGLALTLAAAIPFGDFTHDGNALYFVPLLLAATGFYFAAAGSYQNLPPVPRLRIFWPVAVGLRLIALFIPPGDDIHRYLWEGGIQWHGFNPYLLTPDAPALVHLRDATWALMNHRDWAAIYPPGAELIFKLLCIAGPSVLVMKVIFVLADLLVIVLLLRLNTGQARHRDTVWYAWNPLIIYSFAGGAHYDSLMLAPLLLAVYALFRANPMGLKPAHWGWAAFAAFTLGLAISIKLVPLIFLPVFALALRSRMIVLPLAALVPWLTAESYGFPEHRIFDSFRAFSYVTRSNDFIWWISERLIWSNPEQKNGIYTFVAIAVSALVSLIAWRDWRRALLWVTGAALICSTVVHPWYVTWILPFAAMSRCRAWFVLSGTIFVAFLSWETTPLWNAWKPSILLSLLIALPPLGFAVYELLKAKAHHLDRNRTPEPIL